MNYRGKKHYEEDYLRDVAGRSLSKREVLLELGLPTGGTYGYRVLAYFVSLYDIDCSHFMGRSRAAISNMKAAIPLEQILAGQHPRYCTGDLKRRIIKAGILNPLCQECGIESWRGKPAPLDLDHINGKSWDHKLENLRLLCRNCHAQTDTFCGKNTRAAQDKKRQISTAQRNRDAYRRRQEAYIPQIQQSGIDFTRTGWGKRVAEIIHQRPQKVRQWMQRYMPEFEKTCFRRAT